MKKDMRASASPVALNPAAMADEGSAVAVAFEEVQSSFDKFCLIAGIEALQELLQEEASAVCGDRHQRHEGRQGRRWGKTRSQVAFHGGRVEIERPRVRSCEGQGTGVPSWEAAVAEDWLGKWAMNQMLINVSTRKFRSFGSAARAEMFQHLGVTARRSRRPLAVRRAVGGEHEGVAGERSLRPRFAGDPDRRHAHHATRT